MERRMKRKDAMNIERTKITYVGGKKMDEKYKKIGRRKERTGIKELYK